MYLVIISTWACNLNCTYCRTEKKNIYISDDFLKKSVDLLLTSKHQELKMEFFGGEPLMLPFDKLKKTILYGIERGNKIGKKIEFIITTNGILLNPEKIAFFKKNDVSLILSLDGQARSHNLNRPQVGNRNSYHQIIKNLPEIFKQHLHVYCYTVITPATVEFLVKNFNGLINKGFKKIWLMMAVGPKWSNEKITVLKQQLSVVEKASPGLLKKKGIVLLNLKNWLPPFRFNTELCVNIDGHLYSACLTYLIKDDDVRKKFVIGHIDSIAPDIDALDKKRLTNMEAIEVFFKENNIYDRYKNNLRVGKIFSEFNERLRSEIIKRELVPYYRQLFQDR